MNSSDNLAEIVAGCKAGDGDAFSRLVDIYATACFGYFYRLTGNIEISNDLLSELFVKLFEKIGSYKTGSFEKWLFKVASNIFYDYLRQKQRREKLLNAKRHQFQTTTPTSERTQTYEFDQLQLQLEKLDADTKELILLRFYSGLSFREIAEMRSLPIGTVLSKVHRGLKKLRQLMDRAG